MRVFRVNRAAPVTASRKLIRYRVRSRTKPSSEVSQQSWPRQMMDRRFTLDWRAPLPYESTTLTLTPLATSFRLDAMILPALTGSLTLPFLPAIHQLSLWLDNNISIRLPKEVLPFLIMVYSVQKRDLYILREVIFSLLALRPLSTEMVLMVFLR